MAGIEMPLVAIRAQVASAINFVVICERLHDGSRKTIAISEVLPLNEKGEYRTQDLFLYIPVAKDEDGHILGYHAPTGILPTFLAKAKAYGFDDLTPAFFDPATYGVPPPPLIHGLGENVATHWAPSLKHRDGGTPDPEHFASDWRAWEEKLKGDAKAKRAAAAKQSSQVQVPAPPPPAAAKPAAPLAAAPARPAAPPARPATTPSNRDDATPPPTRNPMMRKPEPEPEAESSVEVDAGLVDDGSTNIRENPLNRPPARPGVARPGGVPPRPPPKKPGT
jgi:pilus assembly protein CpaF